MVFDTGGHFGVRRLHDERADAANENGSITEDPPRHRVRAEEARVTLVVQRVFERCGPVVEQ